MKKQSLISIIMALAICAALLIAPLTGAYAAGSEDAPETLVLTDGAAAIEGGAYPGGYYTWTAETSGKLTLEYTGGSEEEYYVMAYVVGKEALSNISISVFSEEKSGDMTVNAGDVVIINVAGAETAEDVKVTANVSFEAGEGTAVRTEGTYENPYIAKDVKELVFNIEELLSEYVYKWTATDDGILTLGFDKLVYGAILSVNGTEYFQGEPVEISKGDAVYIGLTMNPRTGGALGTYTLYGTFEVAEVEPPVDDPVEPPVDDPVEPPVDDPVEPPVDDPVEPPVDDPVEPPVDDPVEPPVKDPNDTPETGDDTLVFFVLAAVSMIGLVVLVSKKKAF